MSDISSIEINAVYELIASNRIPGDVVAMIEEGPYIVVAMSTGDEYAIRLEEGSVVKK